MFKKPLAVTCIALIIFFNYQCTAHAFSLMAAAPLAGTVGAAAVITVGAVAIYASNESVRSTVNGLAKKVYYQSISASQTVWGVGYALFSMQSLLAKAKASPATYPKTNSIGTASQKMDISGGSMTTPIPPAGVVYDSPMMVADAATASSAAIAQKNTYQSAANHQSANTATYTAYNTMTDTFGHNWGFSGTGLNTKWGWASATANMIDNSVIVTHTTYYFYPLTSGLTTTTTDINLFTNAVISQAATDAPTQQELENAVVAGIQQSANATTVPTTSSYPLTGVGPAVFTDYPADPTSSISNYPPFTLSNSAAAPVTTPTTVDIAYAPSATSSTAYTNTVTVGDFGARLTQFFTDIRATPLFSVPSSFLSSIPTGGNPVITFDGHRFGTHTYDFSSWGSILDVFKALVLVTFSAVAVRIVTLKGGSA